MGNWFGVNAARQLNTVPVTKIPSGQGAGKLACFYDSFACPATAPSAGDTVYLMQVPAQFILTEFIVSLNAETTGNTPASTIGWQANNGTSINATSGIGTGGTNAVNLTGIATAFDANTTQYYCMSSQSTPVTGLGFQFSAQTQIVWTLTTAWTSTTATTIFQFFCYGIVEGF